VPTRLGSSFEPVDILAKPYRNCRKRPSLRAALLVSERIGLADGVFLPRVQRAIWVRTLPRLPRRGLLSAWRLSVRGDFCLVGSARARRNLINREV
jgi:hypothetical protein